MKKLFSIIIVILSVVLLAWYFYPFECYEEENLFVEAMDKIYFPSSSSNKCKDDFVCVFDMDKSKSLFDNQIDMLLSLEHQYYTKDESIELISFINLISRSKIKSKEFYRIKMTTVRETGGIIYKDKKIHVQAYTNKYKDHRCCFLEILMIDDSRIYFSRIVKKGYIINNGKWITTRFEKYFEDYMNKMKEA